MVLKLVFIFAIILSTGFADVVGKQILASRIADLIAARQRITSIKNPLLSSFAWNDYPILIPLNVFQDDVVLSRFFCNKKRKNGHLGEQTPSKKPPHDDFVYTENPNGAVEVNEGQAIHDPYYDHTTKHTEFFEHPTTQKPYHEHLTTQGHHELTTTHKPHYENPSIHEEHYEHPTTKKPYYEHATHEEQYEHSTTQKPYHEHPSHEEYYQHATTPNPHNPPSTAHENSTTNHPTKPTKKPVDKKPSRPFWWSFFTTQKPLVVRTSKAS